jgi:outer membrane protein assembly factor BamD (BamD/ComL family)
LRFLDVLILLCENRNGKRGGQMKKILVVMLLLSTLAACSNKAEELFETAKFEEQQNNRDHAIKLYKSLIEKYPESEQAKEAAKRLAGLQSEPAGSGN